MVHDVLNLTWAIEVHDVLSFFGTRCIELYQLPTRKLSGVAVQFLISSAVKKSRLGSKLTYRHIYSLLIYRSFGALNLILPTQVKRAS